MRDMKDYVCWQGWGFSVIVPKKTGIDIAKEKHDVLAKKKYYKPFKSFKFNRARRQRP